MTKLNSLIKVAMVATGIAACAAQAQAAEICTDCITFSADAPFGIKLNKGTDKTTPPPTVTLEYSTDQRDWKTFNVDTGYNAEPDGGTYKLHIRGTGNSKFAEGMQAKKAHCFTNTVGSAATAIACSGNALTLLDYATVAKGEKPTMNDYAFAYLFYGFTALTAAPELPATNLAEYCYFRMFYGCTSLTAAPALNATTLAPSCYSYMFNGCTSLTNAPALNAMTLAQGCYISMFNGCTSLTDAPALNATTLVKECYSSMFSGCTSLTAAPALPATTMTESCYNKMFNGCTALTAAPALPATTLAQYCYYKMFNGCTSLKVNEDAPGKEWKIPATTGEGATDWGKDMFAGTGGDIPSPPALNTPYYIASAPVALDVAEVAGATYAVTTNGAPATVPCTIDYVTPVKVVYTANEHYMFPGGAATWTTNVVMDADTVTVTLTADQQPVEIPKVLVSTNGLEVAGATVAVTADGEALPADGMVYSNSMVKVVYTADEGTYFADGAATCEREFKADKSENVASAEIAVPGKPGKPKVQLGVVAQRYPWDGVVDVGYKAAYWPKGMKASVEVTVGTSVTTNEFEIAGSGEVVGSAPVKTPVGVQGKASFKAVK